MSLPTSAEVVVVGAGPVGMTAALGLHKHACPDVVVLDGQLTGENTSRALAVHAATLDTLADLDVADRVVGSGRKLSTTTVWTKGQPPISTTYFPPLGKYTKYPFILGIAQHVTEQILHDACSERGIHIHRPHKVVDLKPSDDPAFTDVILDNGHVIRTRCVVAANGSRTIIRQLCNVGWSDPTGELKSVSPNDEAEAANMVVADVTFKSPPPLKPDAINLVHTSSNALMCIYFPGDPYPDAVPSGTPVYRIATGVPRELGAPPSAPGTDYLQPLLDRYGPHVVLPDGTAPCTIEKTVWSSRFRTHSAIADRFFAHVGETAGTGPVCFLGDAAHVHPPMGGQGMNLGIRDAAKLAPVLAEYVAAARAGTASQTALEAWAAQRRKRALEVINFVKDLQRRLWLSTDTKYVLGLIPYNPAWVQMSVLRVLSSFEWFQTKAAYTVSGLADS